MARVSPYNRSRVVDFSSASDQFGIAAPSLEFAHFPLTFTAWFRANSANSGLMWFSDETNACGCTVTIIQFAAPTPGSLGLQVMTDLGTSATFYTPAVGQWFFAALVMTAATTSAYARGVNQTFSSASVTQTAAGSIPFNVTIGGGSGPGGIPGSWPGYAGAWKIWTRALSVAELYAESLQCAPVTRFGFYDYVPLNQPWPANASPPGASEIGRAYGSGAIFSAAVPIANLSLPVPEELAPRRLFLFTSAAAPASNAVQLPQRFRKRRLDVLRVGGPDV
jgi:hypothetical protein